jgi:hypothetical protein
MAPLPTVILPGYLAGASEYEPLRRELEKRGYPARVVPLRVASWLPTLGGRRSRLSCGLSRPLSDVPRPSLELSR